MEEKIIYSKYSNERSRAFSIRTDILLREGKRVVRKQPMYPEGRAHIQQISRLYELLSKSCPGDKIQYNKAKAAGEAVELEYIEKGETLEESLDRLLGEGNLEALKEKLTKYLRFVDSLHQSRPFVQTEEFERVFGQVSLPQGLKSGDVTDIDMVCANLLTTSPPTVLDYEWSFTFPVPGHFVLYRIIHYYIETYEKRRALRDWKLYQEFSITEEELAAYEKMEAAFQRYLTEGHVPMREMYASMSPGVCTTRLTDNMQFQVFFSYGEGFCERNSKCYPMTDGLVKERIELPEGVRELRLDPGGEPCAVEIRRLCFEGREEERVRFACEKGTRVKNWVLISKADPNLTGIQVPKGAKALLVELQVAQGEAALLEGITETCSQLQKEVKGLRRQLEIIQNTKVWKLYRKYRNCVERKKTR